jgi:acyl carrier protein
MSFDMDQLTTLLTDIRPGQDYSKADDFFNQGLLDSLDMTTLVAALESTYGVFLDVDEIVPDNLKSLAAIRSLLARKGVNA